MTMTDPSGIKSYMDDDTTDERVEIILTRRCRDAMSERQRNDLAAGSALIQRAFTPDEPIKYAPITIEDMGESPPAAQAFNAELRKRMRDLPDQR